MIKLTNVSKKYVSFTAVNDISFSVKENQILGFLGPNGAGKTTTMRMLTGYLPCSKGTITILDKDISKYPKFAKQQIGYMPENVALYDDMRIVEFLKFRGKLKGLVGKKLRTNINHVLTTCGLNTMKKRMIRTLSKGYRQRVGLADALIHQPKILILDEPTNGLDPNQIRIIRQLIVELKKKHTIILSTHILSEVEMICDEIVIIDNGIIKTQGSPDYISQQKQRAPIIEFSCDSPYTVIKPLIANLAGVRRIEHLNKDADDANSIPYFRITCEHNKDLRKKITQICHENQIEINTLFLQKTSLEDAFIEFTRPN